MSQRDSHINPCAQDYYRMNHEEKILFRASSFRIPDGMNTAEALALLKERIAKPEAERQSATITRSRIIRIAWSIAAGLLILIALRLVVSVADNTKITTGKGIHTDYIMTDGSSIKLNACSKLIFNKKNFTADRHVTLDGEAFFNVTKGNSFIVTTPNGIVKVLGTSFNVFSRDNNFNVACLSGKVAVLSDTQSVTIGPGESVKSIDGCLIKSNNDKTKYITGWINGEFYFENTPLNIVFSEIERQFNVKFTGKEIVNEFFTGSFVNKDLETALDIVCIPMGLEYKINDNGKISVSNKKH